MGVENKHGKKIKRKNKKNKIREIHRKHESHLYLIDLGLCIIKLLSQFLSQEARSLLLKICSLVI